MIVLDTHIWVWWVHGAPELSDEYRRIITQHEVSGLGVSAISCWEVAKLVEKDGLIYRVRLPNGWIRRSPIQASNSCH